METDPSETPTLPAYVISQPTLVLCAAALAVLRGITRNDLQASDDFGDAEKLRGKLEEIETALEEARSALARLPGVGPPPSRLAGSCTCMTKTPDPSFHDELCMYRLLCKGAEMRNPRSGVRLDPPPAKDADMVNHPKHYNSLGAKCPCGREIECIDVIEHMGLSLGNVVKYTWRADHKNDALEDLKKARWYLDREIGRREGKAEPGE